jgi:hypothetical protein
MEPLSTETSTKSGAPLSQYCQKPLNNKMLYTIAILQFWTNKAKVIKYGVIFASENPLKVELMCVQSLLK